ncbi:MAG TPA: TetR/AcrR family transcriptional regulator [Bacteroidales bacterium]|nr:TetR/AcrR family transcriptional regulator [Bacteroidales bacterium]
MSQTNYNGEGSQKTSIIIKAAQKRFALYGLEKTTMREIAKDVGISKAALYYYFPDKEHIYKEVIEIEQKIFFDLVEEHMQQTPDPELMLIDFVNVRLNYFKTFFNLSRLRIEEFKSVKPILEDTLKKFRKQETGAVERILQKGVDEKVFHVGDIHEEASLFLEVLRGVRSLVFQTKELMYVEQDDYDVLAKKLNTLTKIFIRSLKYKE